MPTPTIRSAEVWLARDHSGRERRAEQIAIADTLRRQADAAEDWALRAALADSAAELERRAGQARLRQVD